MKRFAVIGLGLLGRTVARELSQRGAEVIAVDLEQSLVDAVADHVASRSVSTRRTERRSSHRESTRSMRP